MPSICVQLASRLWPSSVPRSPPWTSRRGERRASSSSSSRGRRCPSFASSRSCFEGAMRRASRVCRPRARYSRRYCALWSKLEAAPLSQILSRSRRGHRRHVSPPALFLRHERRRHARRPHHVRAPRRRHPEDVRELPGAVHRREGDRPDGQAPLLQEQRLPPRHPELHVPGGRLHPRRRHRRRVHLRREVRG